LPKFFLRSFQKSRKLRTLSQNLLWKIFSNSSKDIFQRSFENLAPGLNDNTHYMIMYQTATVMLPDRPETNSNFYRVCLNIGENHRSAAASAQIPEFAYVTCLSLQISIWHRRSLTYSDDTLASFWCLFLVPVNWHQKLVSLSYFSGVRFFSGARRRQHCLFVCKQKWSSI